MVIEEVYWRIKRQIKPNCKQSYFNSKASSVNLRFSKSSSLQNFSIILLLWCKDNAVMEY